MQKVNKQQNKKSVEIVKQNKKLVPPSNSKKETAGSDLEFWYAVQNFIVSVISEIDRLLLLNDEQQNKK